MHATAAKLLDAHAAHILAQLSGDALDVTIDREAAAFLDWLDARPLNSLTDAERVFTVARERVLDSEPTPALVAEIVAIIKDIWNSPVNENTYVHQIIEHKHYTAIVENIASRDKLRNDIIHTIVGNPVYGRLLSDVIYDAISDYMQHNPLTKNVPGMSSLMKMGKGLVEGAGGSAVKGYLQKNIQAIVGRSERTIQNILDGKQIHSVAEQLWHKARVLPLSTVRQYFGDKDIDQMAYVVEEAWNHVRRTDYVRAQVKTGIDGWFARNGSRNAGAVLADIGISREILMAEIKVHARVIVGEMIASGFLEARVCEQLAAFYGSDVVSGLLG
ncbi:hypothetical protein EV700_2709 [Fluviicoccus keumensis]|uniref:Uncharacterized protein n=1 Tax=Fluviicoccus keumensis TaxID=1435465 RepID=A0A4Q7YKF6_9GAMM|nr:hypothetical protein [Fluviicoccus keumensis]RZU38132.1 hypothetical protein EV700_2709 [Fluviicoccus keumensis]